jgi:ORF6N domain
VLRPASRGRELTICLDPRTQENDKLVHNTDEAPQHPVLTVRDQKVVIDVDLARVYGVSTKRLNEQFRRNRKRFPPDFAFQLSVAEATGLRSQLATLKLGRGRHRKYRPWAFTEHGALQVANILRSDRAIAMSVYVIRAFIELREKVAANAAILKRLAEIDKTLLLHDTALREVYEKLLPLLQPPPEPPRRQIGF